MIIVEYKLNIKDDGSLVHPGWVHDGGYFFDSQTHTYIGVALDESERNYYIPDTVVEMTLDEVKEKVKAYPRVEDTGGYTKTDEDIDSEVDTWWNQY